MYSTNSNQEVIIKIIGKLSLEYLDINQLKVRSICEEVLYNYNVYTKEKSLITSDVEEKLQLFIAVKQLEGFSRKTIKNYYYELLKFATYIKKPITIIEADDIRMYLITRGKNLKANSVNGIIFILKSFFGWLSNEEYIYKNPMVKIKSTKVPKRIRQPLSDEEMELVGQSCVGYREHALLNFIYSTGCRLNEVINVDINDINWNDMSLYVIGKGNKERKVYFNTRTKVFLEKYLKNRADSCEALFVTSKGIVRRLGQRAVQKEIKKIAERAKMKKSVFPHLLRHTYATFNINHDMPLHTLQKLMGHEQITTTQIYAQVSDENVRHDYRMTL
jgi:integrase/recombinase XerD